MQHKTSLWSLVEDRSSQAPDQTAFIEDTRRISHAEFRRLCNQTTEWLLAQGVQPGDRVAVWLVNRIEWLALLFALARLGGVLVSVNTRYRSEEVTHILKTSGARMLILQPSFRKIDFPAILADMQAHDLPQLERIAVLDESQPASILGRPTTSFDIAAQAGADAQDLSDPSACAILFTTSGTTKGPKLVMHPQQTLAGHARRCAAFYELDKSGAALLAMLPFCGVFGLNGVLAAYCAGAPVVLMDTFDGPEAARLMREHAISHTFGSDEMYRRLAESAPGERPFPNARCFGFGAFTSSFNECALALWSRGIPLYGLYGSSEVLALFSAQREHHTVQERIEGGGVAVAGSQAIIRIRDIHTNALLGPGQSGEIEISAPSNFMGYFNNPEATGEAVLPDGFFRTGDLGHLRQDGSFVYETRMGDAIRLGGFLVNPVEIEDVLKRFEGVAEAQVVAVELQGQTRVVAFIKPDEDRSPSVVHLLSQASASMAAFKVPARIWFVDSYPVTQSSNGVKTQRNKLRAQAHALLAQEKAA